MSLPRGVEERIDWFLSHNPSGSGMCAQHTWHSLGGDQGNPPAWGASDANACVDKVKASGRYWTPSTWSGHPPRGAWVGYKYGSNGHACLSNGDGTITTTDPGNGKPTGVEDINYPNKWGASGWDVWTDEYNNVRFEVEGAVEEGNVYLSKLVYGQEDSDSVSRLQLALNEHPLEGGHNLPISGNYFDQTDTEVRLCQQQHGFGNDPAGGSSVGPKQAEHLFAGTGNVIINDLPVPEPEPEPEPEPPDPEEPDSPVSNGSGFAWDEYSGKPSGTLTVTADAGYVPLDVSLPKAPGDGLEFHMAYLNCDLSWSGSSGGDIRLKYVRDGGDATAYQDYSVRNGKSDFLITHGQHWEAGEEGVGGKWYINVGGGITKAVIGTRYAKSGGVTYDSDLSPQISKALTGTAVGVGVIRAWAILITVAVIVLYLLLLIGE